MYPYYFRQDASIWVSIEDLPQIKKQAALLIDLRNQEDFNQFHITGFNNYPYSDIYNWLPTLPRHQPIYFICPHGKTAYNLATKLSQNGYQAYAFIGGINYYLQTLNNTMQPYF